MPKLYKDTSKATNAPKTPKKGQNERQTQVTLADVINSILTFGFLAGALFIFVLFLPQKAHSYASLTNYPAKQVKNNLPLVAGIGQNTATTKRKAVKPSRHTLAIFVPVNHGATNPMITTSAKTTHILNAYSVATYGGLIRPNTIAFMVNKSSRLFAVVETRPPYTGLGNNTTKRKGVANNG